MRGNDPNICSSQQEESCVQLQQQQQQQLHLQQEDAEEAQVTYAILPAKNMQPISYVSQTNGLEDGTCFSIIK